MAPSAAEGAEVLPVRWRKLVRDLDGDRRRVLLLVLAVAVSLAAMGAVLGARGILLREIAANYRGTTPAHAAIELAEIPAGLVEQARRRPAVEEAERRGTVLARARAGDGWRPLLLFVVDDFDDLRLNTFTRIEGAWPPPTGSMLIEGTAVGMLAAGTGGRVAVRTAAGAGGDLAVAGLVHDPGLAPAWQERCGYGYITRETLAGLGPVPVRDELRVRFRAAETMTAIDAHARALAAELERHGHAPHALRVPPPQRHPHQRQMEAVLLLLALFGGLCLLLSAVAVAAAMAASLARQRREIAVMKAVGARAGQIALPCLALVAAIGVLAAVVAVPVEIAGAQAFADAVGRLLNLTIADRGVPHEVLVATALAGLLVPLALAVVPIRRACRVTVRQAMDDHGAAAPAGDGWGARLDWRPRILALAVRNVIRQRRRLVLASLLLAVGGGLFIAALALVAGWERWLEAIPRTRHHAVEVRTAVAVEPAPVLALLGALPGVARAEGWGWTPVAPAGAVERTYPDGGHGAFALIAPPSGTTLLSLPLRAGRWLAEDDGDAVVLNQMACERLPGVAVGGRITLAVDGRPSSWQVVGLVEEIGSPATAYVRPAALAAATGSAGRVRQFRIAATGADVQQRQRLVEDVMAALDQAEVPLESVVPLSELRTAMGDHVLVLVRALLALAAATAVVGVVGIATALAASVVERTREFAVLRVLGARPRTILRLVLIEGAVMGVVGWFGAVVLAIPLALVIGGVVGRMSFACPLPLVIPPSALLLWLAIAAAGGLVGALLPARQAAAGSVRVGLAHAG
jgi:putative ABC transport system permease protein